MSASLIPQTAVSSPEAAALYSVNAKTQSKRKKMVKKVKKCTMHHEGESFAYSRSADTNEVVLASFLLKFLLFH